MITTTSAEEKPAQPARRTSTKTTAAKPKTDAPTEPAAPARTTTAKVESVSNYGSAKRVWPD